MFGKAVAKASGLSGLICASLLAVIALIVILLAKSAQAEETGFAHGFSPLGKLAYQAGFDHFGYVNPGAPKGGMMRYARNGHFDSTNTLHYPGTTATDLKLIYDTLVVQSADEPASYYGLLADGMKVAGDLSSVTFRLNPKARWHDGKPVTSADVAFTFKALKEQGAPFYRQVLRNIAVSVEGERIVTFTAGHPGDREFVGLVGTLPIHPKHFWDEAGFEDVSKAVPLGSGPYRVVEVDIPKRIALERVEDYWGAGLGVNRGRWNFGRIVTEYYRDDAVALQAFLKGDLDIRVETDAKTWDSGYDNGAVASGDIVRSSFPPDGMGRFETLAFNLRRPLFQDIRVREAFIAAFDRSWALENLFAGLYAPLRSVYGDSALAANAAASQGEREILKPYLAGLPGGVLRASALEDLQAGDRRGRMARADALLREAGFVVRGGRRIDPSTGKPLEIEVTHLTPAADRVLSGYAQTLDKLGIRLVVRNLDPVTTRRRMLEHDFDMTVLGWSPSPMPGRAESLLWGSALADQPGSYALPGAKDPALNAAIEAMLAARSYDGLIPAAKAFDRILRARRYVVPMWRADRIWIAYSKRIAHPAGIDVEPSFKDRWWFAGAE
ncbi:MAG: ABC transporter substrate-binding protein [Rhodobiaceae bacterium]|nr:ABC transporter substrate-binding protein [Rhodobiaceae bacterium]MCC0048598.1 ABC transporter substrate-binding protein [Rhodobiaceae bacterium]